MNTLGERLSKLRAEKKLSREALGKKIGVTKTSIKNWEDDANQPKVEYLQALADFFGVGFAWLSTGDKPTKAEQPPEWDNNVSPVSHSQLRRAPIINWVQAGVFTEIADSCYDEWEYFVDKGFSDTVYWLRVQGDSMSPEFKKGELLLVDQDRQPKAGDYVIALEYDQDRATFKKYKPNCYDENQGIEYAQLIALNPFYPPLDSRAKPFKVMGVVVMHKRSLV